MAEVVAFAASVIAIIQVTDRVIDFCKSYIESVHDAPSNIRRILVETSALKAILENLRLLTTCNGDVSALLSTFASDDGPIEGCCRAITEVEALIPTDFVRTADGSKKQKAKRTFMALTWPVKEEKAERLLEQIMNYKMTISLAITTDSSHDIKSILSETLEMHNMLSDGQRQEIYKWLQVTDPSPLHYQAQKNYESGTGKWMMHYSEWTSWLDARHRCLWVHGIPGAGKTVLLSHAIQQIKQHLAQLNNGKRALVYYYCYYGHHQDEAVPFLRWILSQLCRQSDLVPRSVHEMYKYGGQPSLENLMEAIEESLTDYHSVYIVIDALDESDPRKDLLKVLRDFVTDPRFKKVQLLASSRLSIDIEKIMSDLSMSISMTNPYIEKDIKLHVRSALESNVKFKRWPRELLVEVEGTVSTSARGMFRWAVCQIDALQRLKPERKIVHEALADLPRTLEETYDRILLQIPSVEQPAVLYTFQLIQHHNHLAHTRLKMQSRNAFYDKETVRELCGCFISITSERAFHGVYGHDRRILAVSFAHYTVREYLDSTNLSERLATDVAAIKQNWRLISLETYLSEASHGRPRNTVLQERLLEGYHTAAALEDPIVRTMAYDVLEAFDNDLYIYCAVSTILMIREWPDEIAQQERAYRLAIGLLDPLTSSSRLLRRIAWCLDRHCDYFFYDAREWPEEDRFWNIQWDPKLSDERALHLTNVLSLACKSTPDLSLARKFMHDENVKYRLQAARMVFTFVSRTYSMPAFDGTVVEVFAQMSERHIDAFRLLLEIEHGLYDPSATLLLSIGGHGREFRMPGPTHECNESCTLRRLLASGANPNRVGYRATPLQIAVYSQDLEAVAQLLDAGADVNSTGDSSGAFWGPTTVMDDFICLHDTSPLYICRNRSLFLGTFMEWKREGNAKRIETMLLRHGAESFMKPSAKVTETLELRSSES